jgi:hypothetical protein
MWIVALILLAAASTISILAKILRGANINLALIDLPALAYQCTHSRR